MKHSTNACQNNSETQNRMSSLHIHPEVEDCRRQVDATLRLCREVLAELTHIREVENPAILRSYDGLFRTLQIDIQRATLEEAELARREELFRLKLERGETLTPKAIEIVNKIVDNEFSKLRRRLADAFDKDARQRNAEKKEQLEEAEAREFPSLYRTIAKEIHPDACGDFDAEKRALWEATQQAYASKDVRRLKTIAEIIKSMTPPPETHSGTLAELQQTLSKAQARLQDERNTLDKLKQCEPYTLKGLIADHSWVLAHTDELQQELAAIRSKIDQHIQFLSSLQAWNPTSWAGRTKNDAEKKHETFVNDFFSATYFGDR